MLNSCFSAIVQYFGSLMFIFRELVIASDDRHPFTNSVRYNSKVIRVFMIRGIGESADNFRNFYEYSYDYLTGKIDINTWAKKHQDNIMSHFDKAMTEKGVGKNDLAHPQNKPTGN